MIRKKTDMKKVAAVIVTYNNAEMLNDLLMDLCRQTVPLNEIIVIDNSGNENTAKIVTAKYPNVRYIRLEENQGTAGGFHEGMKAALENNDLIWTFDDDVRIDNDSLENLLLDLKGLNPLKIIGVIRSGGSMDSKGIPKEMELYTWRGSLFNVYALREIFKWQPAQLRLLRTSALNTTSPATCSKSASSPF